MVKHIHTHFLLWNHMLASHTRGGREARGRLYGFYNVYSKESFLPHWRNKHHFLRPMASHWGWSLFVGTKMEELRTRIPFQSALCLAQFRHPCVCLAQGRRWQGTRTGTVLRCHVGGHPSFKDSGVTEERQTPHLGCGRALRAAGAWEN